MATDDKQELHGSGRPTMAGSQRDDAAAPGKDKPENPKGRKRESDTLGPKSAEESTAGEAPIDPADEDFLEDAKDQPRR